MEVGRWERHVRGDGQARPTCVAVLAGPALPAAALVATVDQVTVTVIAHVVNAFVDGYRKTPQTHSNSKHTAHQNTNKFKIEIIPN